MFSVLKKGVTLNDDLLQSHECNNSIRTASYMASVKSLDRMPGQMAITYKRW